MARRVAAARAYDRCAGCQAIPGCRDKCSPVAPASDVAQDRGLLRRIRLADRTHAVTPFLAMEFSKHAAVLEAEGHRIIKLNVGQPDFGAPPAVLRAMHAALDEGRTSYT